MSNGHVVQPFKIAKIACVMGKCLRRKYLLAWHSHLPLSKPCWFFVSSLSCFRSAIVCHASKFFHRRDFSVYAHHFYTYLKRLTTCPFDFFKNWWLLTYPVVNCVDSNNFWNIDNTFAIHLLTHLQRIWNAICDADELREKVIRPSGQLCVLMRWKSMREMSRQNNMFKISRIIS